MVNSMWSYIITSKPASHAHSAISSLSRLSIERVLDPLLFAALLFAAHVNNSSADKHISLFKSGQCKFNGSRKFKRQNLNVMVRLHCAHESPNEYKKFNLNISVGLSTMNTITSR